MISRTRIHPSPAQVTDPLRGPERGTHQTPSFVFSSPDQGEGRTLDGGVW